MLTGTETLVAAWVFRTRSVNQVVPFARGVPKRSPLARLAVKPRGIASPLSVSNETYTAGTAIPPLTLPAANGGSCTYTYTVDGTSPSGLSFDANRRDLSGMPDARITAGRGMLP